ncbi:hypothetical protein CPB83DRAFT_893455 [Crepidotus variabilis]|uniref:F-box domain-containing protein n=1 Tax=Crepidotus variabilis TaxID=179855 RepID=A0A9P6EGU6_9AGAR|nr:hypothetical protein CPB83DRAFT_893455 [Crepidotus variabilis]
MDTILLHVENTNEVPNAWQQAFLESERAAVNAKIWQIEGEITKLLVQRDALKSQHQRYTSALSPLRRCPNEILVEIFTHFNASDYQDVLNISHVCHGWREVIFGIPILWVDIIVHIQDGNQPTAQTALARIEHHIKCAKGRPLSLMIGEVPHHLMMTIMCTIFAETTVKPSRFAARWRNITIPANSADLDGLLWVLNRYQTLDADPSTLASFTITHSSLDLFPNEDAIIDLKPLTALRTFRCEVEDPDFLDHVLINWGTLTSLTLGTPLPSVSYLNILALCPGLESLQILSEDQGEEIEDGDLITLQNLRELHIISWSCPMTLIERISCPVVESIAFDFSYAYVLEPVVYGFLERSKTDRLHHFHCSGELLFALLDSLGIPSPGFPSLVSLKLDREHNDDHDLNIFDFLTREGHADEFPKLERLEILDHDPSFRPEELESCLQMIRSRLEVSPDKLAQGWRALQRVVVQSGEEESEELSPLKAMRRFHEQGLLVGLL